MLTGAGVSTASGIPGYRDRDGNWKSAEPVQYQDFLTRPAARSRYWVRSMLGWSLMRGAEPNRAHRALAALGAGDRLTALITQNVDGLHQRAGNRGVIDLHGRVDRVTCLSCGAKRSRESWQRVLERRNPQAADAASVARPDGDAQPHDEAGLSDFSVPDCPDCGGIIKPDVVFFGEAVPRERVARAMRRVEDSPALLVAGSSLIVWSGLRFVRAAREAGIAIAIVNRGYCRGADLADVLVDADCGTVLGQLAERLAAAPT